MKNIILYCCFMFLSICAGAQSKQATYIDSLSVTLDSLAKTYPGLEQQVEFSISGASIKEFLRAVASNHELNVSIANNVEGKVTNNFSNAYVKDVFAFICKEYDLRINFLGSIMSFYKVEKPKEKPKKVQVVRRNRITFNDQTGFLSMDLKRDTLDAVVEEITKKSMSNVIIDPALKGRMVSIYVKNRPFEQALDMLALANGMAIEKSSSNFYMFKQAAPKEQPATIAQRNNKRNKQKQTEEEDTDDLVIEILPDNRLNVKANNIDIKEILDKVSKKSLNNYFLYDKPEGKASIYIQNAAYHEFLDYLLSGTKLTYKIEDGVYLVGERTDELLRTTKLVKMENRTIESVVEFIPGELKKGVEIKELTELNGLILSGSRPVIREIEQFLLQVDQVVPVVKIEVMIVDYTKNHTIDAGINVKLGGDKVPTSTTGSFGEGFQAEMTSKSINELISGFNGFGWVSLGKVTPNFYMSVKALEANGNLKVRSTPMLATLNGHEANLTIGNTEYYLETQNSLVGNQSPISQTTQVYKSVQADLSVAIKPFVSSDEQITLEVEVTQSDFTAKISNTAPPGKVSRNFKSVIRVKNEEMILLGGLEEKKSNDSGQGLPFLSRVPVLKWIFGNRNKTNSKSKLHIFIKPVVIY